MSSVSLVIPAFNEARYLEKTLKQAQRLPYDLEIIVINDGSTDETADIAARYADHVINFSENRGKGKALQAGWRLAKGHYLVCLDADLGETVTEAELLIAPVMEKKADIAVSQLKAGKKSGFGLIKRRARTIVYQQTGVWLHSPLSGQRAFERKWLPVLLSCPYKGFGVETQMNIALLKLVLNF